MTIQATVLTALAAASEQVERAAERLSRAGVDVANPTGDSADISEEMVRLLAAKAAFQTAVQIAQTADEISDHTLDILA